MDCMKVIPLSERIPILSIGLGISQIEFIRLLGLSNSSLSRLKAGQLKSLSIEGLKRVFSIDPNIVMFLLGLGKFSKPTTAYNSNDMIKLKIQRMIGELASSEGVSDENN